MSDFKFSCPKCGQNILCDTSNAGMQIPCPGCQTTLTVPPPPPPVPSANVPGKLSINKTVSHHAPAPAATPAPAQGRPITAGNPTVAKKKNPAMIWGSVAGGVLLVALVAYFGFIVPAQKEREVKARQEQEEADRQAAEQKRLAAEAAKPKTPKATWNLDLSEVKFPDRPASGKINGQSFTAEKILFQNGVLTLQQASGQSSQFVISSLRPSETNAYNVTIDDAAGLPRVVLNWKQEPPAKPGMTNFSKGYAMKLEFDPPAAGKVSGKIYLCVPDELQSFVAGNFESGPRTGTPPGVKPVGGNRPPRKKGPVPPPQ